MRHTRQIITLLALLSSFACIGQMLGQESRRTEWYPVGAQWHYQRDLSSPPLYDRIGYDKYTVVSSEEENGYLKKKIEHAHTDYLGNTLEVDYFYRYVRGAKVYELNSDSLCLISDFEAKEGDRLDIYIRKYDSGGENEYQLKDLYMRLRRYEDLLDENNSPLRRAHLDLCYLYANGTEEIKGQYSVLEYIGSALFFHEHRSYQAFFYLGATYLRCYTDGMFEYQNPAWKQDVWYGRNPDCEAVFNYYEGYPLGMDTTTAFETDVRLVYCPSGDELMLENGVSWTLFTLYDLAGKVVRQSSGMSRMSLSDLPRSTFLASVLLPSGQVLVQKIRL